MGKLTEGGVAKAILTGLLSGGVAVAAALGFSTPKDKFKAVETRISVLEQNKTETAVQLARMDQKLDDLIDGLGIHRRNRRGP